MSTEQSVSPKHPEHRRPTEPAPSAHDAQPAAPPPTADGSPVGTSENRDDAPRATRRIVISSLTGKPITWDSPEQSRGATAKDAHEADLLRDVPPHWGRGS